MKHLIQRFKKFIFLNSCSLCKKGLDSEELYLCAKCLEYLKSSKSLKNIGNYYYLYFYNEKIKGLLSDYKLKNRRGIGKVLGELIEEDLKTLIKKEGIQVVIPVPISKKRLNERGFNQVEEILDYCKIKYERIERVRDTQHMYNLKTQEERAENVKGVFKINSEINGKKILIVDDILTTGATIREIVKEVRNSCEVEDIVVFTLGVAQSFIRRGERWD